MEKMGLGKLFRGGKEELDSIFVLSEALPVVSPSCYSRTTWRLRGEGCSQMAEDPAPTVGTWNPTIAGITTVHYPGNYIPITCTSHDS